MHGGDGGRNAAGHVLLVRGLHQVRNVTGAGRNFYCDGGGRQIVEWAQRGLQRADGKLASLKFCGDILRSRFADRQGSGLRRVPRDKGPVVLSSRGQQRGVESDAFAIRRGVQRNVNGRMRSVGLGSALIERDVDVGVAEHQRRNTARLKFLAQSASEGERDVFLR